MYRPPYPENSMPAPPPMEQPMPAVGFEHEMANVPNPAYQPQSTPGGALYPPISAPTPVDPSPVGTPPNIGFEGQGATKVPLDEPEVVADENQLINKTDGEITENDVQRETEEQQTLYFKDGKRRIDYVLAYKDTSDAAKAEKRRIFEENLQNEEGLELETEDKKYSQDGKTYFVKIHAPWEVLTRVAEIMRIKMPIKENDLSDDLTSKCFKKIPNPFVLSERLVPSEPDYFTADFTRDREHMFIIEDKETFFSDAQRGLIVYELLLRTRYEQAIEKFGIDRLLRHNVYTGAFTLHEGPYLSKHSFLTEGFQNDRQRLYETWARPGRWFYYQPLDLIRKYFGEKVAIYFGWLGFYTFMLIPASIIGVIVFLYGFITLWNNPPSQEICDKSGPGNFTMCPLCDRRCSYWKLSGSCLYSRLSYLFDNPATVFFACFMAIWATMFLEFWKRQQAEIQYDWDVADFELEEHMRPEFEAKVQHRKMNPITQAMEPYLPFYSRIPRKCGSIVTVLFMIMCVLVAVFGVIMYRIIVVSLLYASSQEVIRQNAKITTTITAAFLNLIVIMLLNRIYQKIAIFLTDMEYQKTDSDYEDSFTFKMFLFQFINFYSSIFYIAFFKGRVSQYPGAKHQLNGVFEQEMCDPAGCLIELCIQLAIVMVGKQAFNNAKEILLPKILNWLRARNAKKNESEDNLYTRWEQDNDLASQPPLGLFDEYLEMVIQYGFVTIFVAAFPLAPLCALINNVIEVRLDAYKFVTQWRRTPAFRAQDIGIWYGILRGVSFIAVLSNAMIIAWTSDFIPKLVYIHTISPDNTLHGYINNSLSYFNVSDFQPQSVPDDNKSAEFGPTIFCRYSDYRNPPWSDKPYAYTATYWHIFTARLAFIVVFEHIVFFLTWLVSYIIPDVPARVKQLMLREVFLAREARYQSAFSTLKDDQTKRRESEAKLA